MKEKISYKVSSFIDYKNIEHKFVVAAVSEVLDEPIWFAGGFFMNKRISIGVSICNPDDTFNETTGAAAAINRARNNYVNALYTHEAGLIGTKMVEGLLDQEIKHVQTNPGKYIKGYDEAAAKYTKHHAAIDTYVAMSDEEKGRIDWLASLDINTLKSYMDLIKHIA